MRRSIEAVIFDMDGLLIDSEPLQIRAWRNYLDTQGKVLTNELLAQMYGLRLSDSAQVVARVLEMDVTPEQIAIDRDRIFLATVPGNIEARPGAIDLVKELKRRGTPIALATSGHRVYVDLALESAGIPTDFDVEVTGEIVERGKPHPETFLTAAALLDVEPSACLVLEDSPNGVRAAKAAGMTCIAIPNDDTSGLDLAMADKVMASLDEVLGWLDASPGTAIAP